MCVASRYSCSNYMKEIVIITHSGGFHADDVFAVATIILTLPPEAKYSIVRTRDEKLFSGADYVIDVGQVYNSSLRRFDHHQTEGAGVRDNGIPYASFGLVWKEFGPVVSGDAEIARMIEQKLVIPVDALDNGVNISMPVFEGIRSYTISDYLYSYWIDEDVDDEQIDQIFHQVVSMAKELIAREVTKANNILLDQQKVEEVYQNTQDKKIIVLDSYLAWGRVLMEKPEPLVVVYPASNRLQWNAKTVPAEADSFNRKALFPIAWAGKTGEELQKITKVSDALFCHRNRFIATAGSKEGALQLAKILIS